MKGVINDQIVLLRAPEGPLVVYLDRFASATSKKGYAVRSVHRQVFSQLTLADGLSRRESNYVA